MSNKNGLSGARFCHKFAYSGCHFKKPGKHMQQTPHNREYHLGELIGRGYDEDIAKAVEISNLLKENEELHATHSMYHRYQGEVLLASGKTRQDFVESEKYFVKSLQLDSENADSYHGYARLLHQKLDNKEKAKECFLKALSLRPNDSMFNWDYGDFLLENGKTTESLEYFEKVNWGNDHFTTQDGYADLSVYFEALIECNKFDDYFKLRNKIVLENMYEETKDAIAEWDNMGSRLINLTNEIGDMLDPDNNEVPNNDNNLAFDSWWNDKVNIVTLLKKIELFDNDNIEPLCKYLENQMKQENETNEEQQDIDVMNWNDNNNNDNHKELKKQECLDLFEKSILLCQALGVSQSKMENIVSRQWNDKNKLDENIENIKNNESIESENKDISQKKMELNKLESLCSHYGKMIDKLDSGMKESIDYKVVHYQEMKNFTQKLNDHVTNVNWQQQTGQILHHLFEIKNVVSKMKSKYKETNDEYDKVAKKTREITLEYKSLQQRYDIVKQNLQNESFAKDILKHELNKLSTDLSQYQEIEKKCEKIKSNCENITKKATQHHGSLTRECDEYWQNKEACWYCWNHHDIASWMIYQLETKITDSGTNEMTYQYILNKLKDEKYKAKYLQNMTIDDLLNDFGFEKSKESKYEKLIEMIEQMCEKYPMPKVSKIKAENSHENENQIENGINHKIEKYFCPITGEIMKNAVTAMNGKIYEKQSIIEYLRKYKQFPNDSQCVENVELAISLLQENLPLKQEIALAFDNQPPFKKARYN